MTIKPFNSRRIWTVSGLWTLWCVTTIVDLIFYYTGHPVRISDLKVDAKIALFLGLAMFFSVRRDVR